MHSSLRSSPLRGTRINARWQPYSPARSASSTSPEQPGQSSGTGANTTPPRGRTTNHTLDQTKLASHRSQSHSEERNIIEQAVSLLSEIWEPYGARQNGLAQRPPNPGLQSTSGDATLMPIRAFVCHILRHSRTTSGVLQSALCYIEGIRGKLPEIAAREAHRATPRTRSAKPLQTHLSIANISQLDIAALGHDASPSRIVAPPAGMRPDPMISAPHPLRKSASAASLEDADAQAPSPLLCPRRTFLAALVLSHKFIMEKCYSNRAWAKIAGLPPREVGRCERALGEALNWRLWVGKVANAACDQAAEAHDEAATARRQASDADASVPTPDSCAAIPNVRHVAALDQVYAPFLTGPALSPGSPGLTTSPSSRASSASPASITSTGELDLKSHELGQVQVYGLEDQVFTAHLTYALPSSSVGLPSERTSLAKRNASFPSTEPSHSAAWYPTLQTNGEFYG
ncbi:hypothetical protein BD626DRAFT_563211 [Schizophyllum amplum]|uniref:Cyclin N-terminal domain-containing protein n=1 Tax=Schizophyllum amplum TaxID=97359 RepID=A0A550CXD9_9AGAR|nr:hypothetical protein BD626DRAFT_563211 [Auriculariopsis ampla]